ncbi:MAG: hypothetical protein NTX26_00365 [Candidatus Parcubacteria bacterium]|nr:hypothetical protein [Candidatus Parcubacteria bacterium]
MSKIIKILAIIVLVILIIVGGFYIYKNILNSSNTPSNNSLIGQNTTTTNKNAMIGDLKFAVAPAGIGTPGWEPEPGYTPEYKMVFSVGQQVMVDFVQVTNPLSVEVKMYDKDGQEANFFVPFSLKVGNNGNCCFSLPTQAGEYTVKVFSAGEIILTKSLEIK